MKTFYLILTTVLISITVNLPQPLDTLWTKTISDAPAGNVFSSKFKKCSPDEFVVVGQYRDSLFLAKLNSQGEYEWQRYYYDPIRSLTGSCIDIDGSGNLYVIIRDYLSSSWWQLVKFNQAGDSIWSYTVDDQVNNYNMAHSIVVNSDFVYLAGAVGYGLDNFTLYKFDLDGQLMFSRTYPVEGSYNAPYGIACDPGGNVIMAGASEYFSNGGYILKCNSDGDTLWSRSVNGFRISSVLTDNGGNIIVTGDADRIIKYTPGGDLLFDKALGSELLAGSCILQYDNENIFVIGAKKRGPGSYAHDIYFGKYSSVTGDSVWAYIYNFPEPTYGATGQDGAVFFDSNLLILSHCFTNISGGYFDSIFLSMFLLEDIPMPVELMSFTANTGSDGEVILRWASATETNNRGFEIQRRIGNWEFNTIGFVKGNGTTSEQHNYNFTDRPPGRNSYSYRLKQYDYDGSFHYSDVVKADFYLLSGYRLEQNYPNPFNPETIISYQLPSKSFVTIKIYDVLGNEIVSLVNQEKPAGKYQAEWNAKNNPSGVYFCQLKSKGITITKKMILAK